MKFGGKMHTVGRGGISGMFPIKGRHMYLFWCWGGKFKIVQEQNWNIEVKTK